MSSASDAGSHGAPAVPDSDRCDDRTLVSDARLVLTDEADGGVRITLQVGDAAPADLLVNAHAKFGPDGLIHRYRTFFDTDAITERPKS